MQKLPSQPPKGAEIYIEIQLYSGGKKRVFTLAQCEDDEYERKESLCI